MRGSVFHYIGLYSGEFPLLVWISGLEVVEKPVVAKHSLPQAVVIPTSPFQEAAGTAFGPAVEFVLHVKVPGRAIGVRGMEER